MEEKDMYRETDYIGTRSQLKFRYGMTDEDIDRGTFKGRNVYVAGYYDGEIKHFVNCSSK